MSRSVLDERFRTMLGRSPIRYLTEWRMHLADDLLATTTYNLGEIARRVGYESEESFSRAFKRSRGVAPGAWRAARHAGRLSRDGLGHRRGGRPLRDRIRPAGRRARSAIPSGSRKLRPDP